MMKTPRIRRAKRQIDRLHEEILARHRPEDREGEPRNLTDDILALHREDPQFLPESDLTGAVVGPYLAGMHTASNLGAFMFYEVLKNPPSPSGFARKPTLCSRCPLRRSPAS